MEKPDAKTFCVAPWFQVRNENDGAKMVCCAMRSRKIESAGQEPLEFLNTSDNIELKKQLHEGTRANACAECWRDEDNGRISQRQRLNGVLTNNSASIEKTWVGSYFKRKDDFMSDEIMMADIKVGNTCNHSCVMCVPDDSSLIYNDWRSKPDAFFINDKLKSDPGYLDRIKLTGYANRNYNQYVKSILSNTRLKYLKLLGGEPLLDRHLLALLKELPERQKGNLSLYIITNGSQNLLKTKQFLGDFKSIKFSVSLEGTSLVQNYARYGSDWDTVSANIVEFSRSFPSDITVHTTLQTTTIMGFKELAEWTRKNQLAMSLGLCQDPYYLSFSSLPEHVRAQVKHSLKNADIDLIQNNIGDEASWPISKIIDIMENTPFDTDHYEKFLQYIKWYEGGKEITPLRDIYPALFVDKNQQVV